MKKTLFLVEDLFEFFSHPSFTVGEDRDRFGGNGIVHTEGDVR